MGIPFLRVVPPAPPEMPRAAVATSALQIDSVTLEYRTPGRVVRATVSPQNSEKIVR